MDETRSLCSSIEMKFIKKHGQYHRHIKNKKSIRTTNKISRRIYGDNACGHLRMSETRI